MNEFFELIKKASKQLDVFVEVTSFENGDICLKAAGGTSNYVTAEECIAKLKEWATPAKPDFVMIKVPYSEAEFYAKHGQHQLFAPLCQEAIKPYEV